MYYLFNYIFNDKKKKMSQKIGYIRVSSKNQNLDRQLEVMRKHKVEKVFQEKISAKDQLISLSSYINTFSFVFSQRFS